MKAEREQRKAAHMPGVHKDVEPEGSKGPFEAKKGSWEFLTYSGDKERQTEKDLKHEYWAEIAKKKTPEVVLPL